MQRNHKIQTLLTSYGLTGLGFTAIYLAFFHTPLLSSLHVLFYRGVLFNLLTTVICTVVAYFLYRSGRRFAVESIVAAIVMSASIHVGILIVFPVTFDRSVTMYLLNKLNDGGHVTTCKGKTESELESLFINEYVMKNAAISRRVYEESLVNMVKKDGSCVLLTSQGKEFLKWSEIVKKLYNIQ